MILQASLFEDERPQSSGPAAVDYRRSSAILNKGVGRIGDWVDYSLNPYVGCQFGCSYCYAAFFHPDEERVANWGKWVSVKENALSLVRRARGLEGKTILIGSATDPYQPIERKLRLTRSIVEYLATLRPQPRVIVQTRSPLTVRDIDVFRKLPEIRVNLSVTTDDDSIRKAFEPGCPAIERRIQALAEMATAGVRVGAGLAPLLPMRDPIELVHRLRGLGVGRLWAGTFHVNSRPFSSSTGAEALRIAKELNWSVEASERVCAAINAEAVKLGMRQGK